VPGRLHPAFATSQEGTPLFFLLRLPKERLKLSVFPEWCAELKTLFPVLKAGVSSATLFLKV